MNGGGVPGVCGLNPEPSSLNSYADKLEEE